MVSFDGTVIAVRDPDKREHQLPISDLRGVVIETDDSGPWGADLWWLLFGADDLVAVAFPGGATDEQIVIDQLMALPGFDFEAMTRAMSSTDVAVFPVWRAA
ncbi:hypothetical protein ASD79_12380 [Caulobacter sp. Root655]|nr:hypothetical protein ASD79_12380 [Caulobacter sp. Root655]